MRWTSTYAERARRSVGPSASLTVFANGVPLTKQSLHLTTPMNAVGGGVARRLLRRGGVRRIPSRMRCPDRIADCAGVPCGAFHATILGSWGERRNTPGLRSRGLGFSRPVSSL